MYSGFGWIFLHFFGNALHSVCCWMCQYIWFRYFFVTTSNKMLFIVDIILCIFCSLCLTGGHGSTFNVFMPLYFSVLNAKRRIHASCWMDPGMAWHSNPHLQHTLESVHTKQFRLIYILVPFLVKQSNKINPSVRYNSVFVVCFFICLCLRLDVWLSTCVYADCKHFNRQLYINK